jgi:hypothetical protein
MPLWMTAWLIGGRTSTPRRTILLLKCALGALADDANPVRVKLRKSSIAGLDLLEYSAG